MDKHISTIEKNAIEEIRVALSEYRGYNQIGIRIFANYDSVHAEKRPTKKGINLRVNRLPELIAALQEAEREAIEAGLLDPSAADEAG